VLQVIQLGEHVWGCRLAGEYVGVVSHRSGRTDARRTTRP
jgi:hypothetical protein